MLIRKTRVHATILCLEINIRLVIDIKDWELILNKTETSVQSQDDEKN